MCVCFGKELQGELGKGLHFPKLYVVKDRLKMIGFLSFWPNTSSYGECFVLVTICENIGKGNIFTICDHVSYCESQTVRRNVFIWQLVFSISPLDHGA